MSIKIMSAVWEHSRAKGSELLLLLAIADHADDQGQAFPAIAHLAKKIRLDIRTVQRLCRKLEKLAELSITVKAGPGERNLYLVTFCQGGGDILPGGVVTQLVHQGGDTASSPQEPSEEPSIEGIPSVLLRKTSPKGENSAEITAQELITLWNEATTETLQPKVQKLTTERQRFITLRLRIHPERLFWTTVCTKAAASMFLRGEKVDRDGRTFLATFDWLLKPGSALKVYEGNYDDRPIDIAIERHGAKTVKQAIVNKHQEESFLARIEEKAYGTIRSPQLLSDTDEDE